MNTKARRKGIGGELCTEEFPRANEIAALSQSHDKLTAGMQHSYICCISYTIALTNQVQVFA
jgi:hypothetical protein